jgi:hypothetical protein
MTGPQDPIDRTIDEVLASMLEGEPSRVTGASVRRAASSPGRTALPMWLAAAAVLIVLLGVFLRTETPAPVLSTARTQQAPTPAPRFEASPAPTPSGAPSLGAAAKAPRLAMTSEPVYEGLPRLEVASINLPEPLDTTGIGSDPIRITVIEIPPLTVSGLTNEQENK